MLTIPMVGNDFGIFLILFADIDTILYMLLGNSGNDVNLL